MTTNQTIDGVPRLRELLERVATEANHMLGFTYAANYDECRAAVDELRALLDAPAKYETCKRCDGECVIHTGIEESPTTLCNHCDGSGNEPAAQPQPDPVLCRFYDVTDWPGLVRELVGHVAQLQDSAKRNVKPWEDTFPATLLPAYIERVNAANAAEQPAPVAVVLPIRALDQEDGAFFDKGWNACLDQLKRLNPSL